MRVIELRGSRRGTDATDKSSSAELIWSVSGSTSLDDCRDALTSYVPNEYDGLLFKSLSWEHHGAGVWEFTATYAHPDTERNTDLDVGEYSFSFETGGSTVKRTVSMGTRSYAGGATAPDFQGAIGVTIDKGERSVEGVEIGIPALKFSIRKRVPQATLTLDYVVALHNLSFTVNSAPFLGFAAGELLFVGASGSQATNADPEITYNFVASPNAYNMSLGGIGNITKGGHEYLWVLFEDEEDGTAGMTVKRPQAVYCEQVYDTSNFSALGIV